MKKRKIMLSTMAVAATMMSLAGQSAIAESNLSLFTQSPVAQRLSIPGIRRLPTFPGGDPTPPPVPAPGDTSTGSGSTSESETITRILTHQVYFASLDHVGGGDADVHSKDGRHTEVEVNTFDLNHQADHVSLTVEYRVEEGSYNHTELEKSETIRIEAPDGYCINSIAPGRRYTNFKYNFQGEDHSYHDISNRQNVSGTYFSRLRVRFDGKDDDDNGNARLDGSLGVPVVLKACRN